MFKMLEVVGSSQAGFSEAVKDAVEQVLEFGEKVHFFEVVEQRGAVRAGRFKEFQVKLKPSIKQLRIFAPPVSSPLERVGICAYLRQKKTKFVIGVAL